MKNKIVILLLTFIFIMSCFISCGKENSGSDSDNGSSSESTSESVDGGKEIIKDVTDKEVHLVDESKRLHRVSVKDTGRVFVSGGKTDYRILAGGSTGSIIKAASFLSNQIGSCTGVYPTVVYDADGDGIIDGTDEQINWTKDSKFVVLDSEPLEKQAGVKWATETEKIDLGYSGYMMKTVGDTVFMKVNTSYGYQTVVLSFLREVLGYEWFGEDTITFTKTGETLPDLDIVEKPDFDLNYRSGYVSTSGKFATGQTDDEVFVFTDGMFVHNSLNYLPPATYAEEHSKWYSDKWGTYDNKYLPDQLCYTAHGDKTEYNAMLEAATNKMMKYLAENTTACTITFTQQDNFSACDCPTCSAASEKFGSISSTYIMFVNDLEDKVRARLEKQAEENGTETRKLTILFFAYNATQNAPVSGETKDEYKIATNPDNVIEVGGTTYNLPYNKTYENGIVCNENVGCFWAPIKATFNRSFYEDTPANKEAKQSLEKWGLLTNKIYAWIYDMNFYEFLFPYNSYDSVVETARCLKDNNADFLFVQAQGSYHNRTNAMTPCFGGLKTYTAMSVRFDVNMDYGKAVDRFFENYYRDAAPAMREYYEKMTSYLRLLEEKYPSVFTGNIYDSFVSQPTYWSISLMNDWLSLCDKAYAAIEKYKSTDAELYETLRKHITIETIFPRFVICEFYGGYYSNAEITAMRQVFYDDCIDIKIEAYSENTPLANWFTKWGVA